MTFDRSIAQARDPVNRARRHDSYAEAEKTDKGEIFPTKPPNYQRGTSAASCGPPESALIPGEGLSNVR